MQGLLINTVVPLLLSMQQSMPPISSQSPSTQAHPNQHPSPSLAYNPFPPPAMGGYSPFGMPYFRPPMMMSGTGRPHPNPSSPHSSHPPPPFTPSSPFTAPARLQWMPCIRNASWVFLNIYSPLWFLPRYACKNAVVA